MSCHRDSASSSSLGATETHDDGNKLILDATIRNLATNLGSQGVSSRRRQYVVIFLRLVEFAPRADRGLGPFTIEVTSRS